MSSEEKPIRGNETATHPDDRNPGVGGQTMSGDEKSLCDRVCEMLRSRKAEGDAYLERHLSLRLQVRGGKLEEISRAEVRGLAVRAFRDGRLGFVYTSKLDPDSVASAAAKACSLSTAASPRDDLLLAPTAGPGDGHDEGIGLDLHDSAFETRSFTERQEWIRACEAAALAADPKVRRSDGASWEERLHSCWIANTRGLFRHFRRSHVEVAVQVIAEDGGEKQSGDAGCELTHWGDLPDPVALGQRAGQRAVRLLGGRPVETGRYPVVFSRESGWALLVYLATALNGEHLSRGRSWLAPVLKDDPEAAIGSALVTVRDDGNLKAGPACAPFDGEGVDTGPHLLLENGKIRGRLCNLTAGKRLGLASTGNAQRGSYETLPEIRSSNLWLTPGEQTPEQILAPVKRGLWVWGLSGWWIGLDPSNPQFSSAAFGLWIEDGRPVRPVAQITVAGSVQEILSNIEAVGNDLVWERSTQTPTFRVREMSVSGA